jgi:hypothetical protein
MTGAAMRMGAIMARAQASRIDFRVGAGNQALARGCAGIVGAGSFICAGAGLL